MRRQKDKADHFARHTSVQQIAHRKEITQRFRHFLAFDLQHFVVQPNICKPTIRHRATTLCKLVFMMWKHQVVAASMNVKARSQQFIRHCRAFDVPARPAIAPRTVPPRRHRIRRLPQHKIHRVALIRCHLNAGAGNHIV